MPQALMCSRWHLGRAPASCAASCTNATGLGVSPALGAAACAKVQSTKVQDMAALHTEYPLPPCVGALQDLP